MGGWVEILELRGKRCLFKILQRIERRIRIDAKPNEACSSAGLTRGFGFRCGGEREEASSHGHETFHVFVCAAYPHQ
jgi:hypothetical protein